MIVPLSIMIQPETVLNPEQGVLKLLVETGVKVKKTTAFPGSI